MEEQDKVKVLAIGITNSRLQQGVYLLVLAEEGGPMRIPIIIGAAEAQSIAVCMERLVPPRPLTHDLMVSICHSFEIELNEVLIHRYEKGIFYASLLMRRGGQEMAVDARVSDAVAVALRANVPIYVTRDVLTKTGYDVAQAFEQVGKHPEEDANLENMSDEYLANRIKHAVEVENYEEAALIQQILQKRKL